MNPFLILRDAWFFFSRNFSALLLLCFPLILLESVVGYFMQQSMGKEMPMVYLLILGLMFSPLYKGALILFLGSRSEGAYPSHGQILSRALSLWPAYALLTALSAMLILCGLSLLILPGIWLMIKITFADYLLLLQGRAPMPALRESFVMTEGQFWPVFATLSLSLVALSPFWLALLWLIGEQGAVNPEGWVAVLLQAFMGFLQLFSTVVMFRFFMLLPKPADKA